MGRLVTCALTVTACTVIAQASPDLVVSTAWLSARLDDPGVVVITTGERAEYERGHIPGARFVSHEDTVGPDHRLLDRDALARSLARAGARDDARIVVYGEEAMATGWLYMALASLGHGDHVSMLDGNMAAWRRDGRSVSTDTPPAATGRLTPRAAPDVVVDAAWVRARLESPGVRIIDVRTTREWDRGRLPGATFVLWQDLFTDLGTLRFKPKEEIRALLSKAGVRPSDQVVTYCAIGMRASLMHFAARYAGYDTRVYVGSWQDWSRQPGYPVVR